MWRYISRDLFSANRSRYLIAALLVLVITAGLVTTDLLLKRITTGSDWWAERFADSYIEVYLTSETPVDDTQALRSALGNDSRIATAVFVSADDARREAEQYLGSIVFSRLPDNPLPSSIRLYLDRSARSLETIEQLTDSLAVLPVVSEITYPREHLELYTQGKTLLADYQLMVNTAALGWVGLVVFIGMLLLRRSQLVHNDIWWYLGVGPGILRGFALLEGFVLAAVSAVAARLVMALVSDTPALISIANIRAGWITLPLAAGLIGGIAGWLGQQLKQHTLSG